MKKPHGVLKHLQHLTASFNKNGKEIYYIYIYSKKINGEYVPFGADGEGISCVDDVARAVILALELYEFKKDPKALEWAEKWINFLEYMQNEKGLITNFIEDKTGLKKDGVYSSHYGGAWWSARAKWAWAKAYKITKNQKYLDFYFKIKINEDYQNDVASILLIAGLEIFDKEDKNYLKSLTERISNCKSKEGYFLHKINEPIYLRAYHQLEAMVKAAQFFKDEKLIQSCNETVKSLVKDVINNNFYGEYLSKSKKEINPYCVTPLVRGLYELYLVDKRKEYLRLINKCFKWFDVIYDPKTGRCFDWVSKGKVSADCGAEASIEAGFSYLIKTKL